MLETCTPRCDWTGNSTTTTSDLQETSRSLEIVVAEADEAPSGKHGAGGTRISDTGHPTFSQDAGGVASPTTPTTLNNSFGEVLTATDPLAHLTRPSQ